MRFDTPAPVSVLFDVPAYHIRFIAADRADTVVEVLPADAKKSRDAKAAEQTTVHYGDGVLRIQGPSATNSLIGPSGAVEITVKLPAAPTSRARPLCAELRGVGRLGDVTFDGAQGPVKLDETASARLTVLDGDVSVGNWAAPPRSPPRRATSASPRPCAARSPCAPSTATSPSAPPRGLRLPGRLSTGYGRIRNTLNNTAGAAAALTVHATTAYGDITAAGL